MNKLEDEIYKKLLKKMNIAETEMEGFTYDSPLFETDTLEGVSMGLDSVDALELVVMIYDTWGIDVPTEDMSKLHTVNAIAEYIRKHKDD